VGLPCYYLISVSNAHNLALCIQCALAGFTNSISGVWTFLEVREGDFVSFLYGARAHNLYKVAKREAVEDFTTFPPWPSVTFKESGRTYYFPFRHFLTPLRQFNEPLVRSEFAYVAENLLLRAGYRKTHFQADQTTLQNVSQMGIFFRSAAQSLVVPPYSTFIPLFTGLQSEKSVPNVFHFQEVILQAAIRQYLQNEANLAAFLSLIDIAGIVPSELEVLGEKALSQGHVDILIKDRVPIAVARKIVVEVKRGKAQLKDVGQLKEYMKELGEECVAGVLIAQGFPKSVLGNATEPPVKLVRYDLELAWSTPKTFAEILSSLRLQPSK
jgi:hypothetical protein